MADPKSEGERKRLTSLYAQMDEAELSQLAAEARNLTAIAQEVLFSELTKRGLAIPADVSLTEAPTPEDRLKPFLLRRYRDLPEATVAKSILDSAGIDNFLADDNIVRLDWFYSNLVGGIKVFVREEDAEAAKKLLEQNIPRAFEAGETGSYEQPSCPRCHSFDVSFDGLDRRFSYASLFVFPIPVTNKGWKCASFGHAWSDEETPLGSQGTPA